MKLLFFCTRWGSEQIPWPTFAKQVKDAGYDGIETTLPADKNEQQEMFNEFDKHSLRFIGVHWDTVTPDFVKHTEELERRLTDLMVARPMFITSHTGKDFFSFDQNVQLLNLAQSLATKNGVQVMHETHRGKFSFAAHITDKFLTALPWLTLTLDISHWFTVAESFLHDQQPAVNLALSRTEHLHSRVGSTQAPQVTNPAAPECKTALDEHLLCWDKVIARHKNESRRESTITCEFGPVPYMPLTPFTNDPVANQWQVNQYMMNLLRERYTDTW